MNREIISTYRVQFSPRFSFTDCTGISDYLKKLGISHLYASPVLEATKGSQHGYDVTDFTRVREELGGEESLVSLMQKLRSDSIGWIQDIVPNHMAFNTTNPFIYDVLKRGESSGYSRYFDINWKHHAFPEGKLCVPFLSGDLLEEIANWHFIIGKENGPELFYRGSPFPLCSSSLGTLLGSALQSRIDEKIIAEEYSNGVWNYIRDISASDDNGNIASELERRLQYVNGQNDLMKNVLDDQNYVFRNWQSANKELNYRRFFAVNGLIALRQEDETVFSETHRKVLSLANMGLVDGLRIDHVDGLLDPERYLSGIRTSMNEIPVFIEKILGYGEELKEDWKTVGTTGYDFLGHCNALFINGNGLELVRKNYESFTGLHTDLHEEIRRIKNEIMNTLFSGVIDDLTLAFLNVFKPLNGERMPERSDLRQVLVEFISRFSVYRTYISTERTHPEDREMLLAILNSVREAGSTSVYCTDCLEMVLNECDRDHAYQDFIIRMQQYTPGIYAKSIEDTLFFRYVPLLSLNEVGMDPVHRDTSLQEFHDFCIKRAKKFPHSLNALSTHDTKTGEDVRARINVLSEIPDIWNDRLAKWSEMNKELKANIGSRNCPAPEDEYYMYQVLLGSYPLDAKDIPEYFQRVKNHLIKALREANRNSNWETPDIGYESGYVEFLQNILDPEKSRTFLADFLNFQKVISFHGFLNSLSQKIIQLTAPGVPDIYQGTEVWNFNLVDPDNRRDVPFDHLTDLMEMVVDHDINHADPESSWTPSYSDGSMKMYVTRKILNFRRLNRNLITDGMYIPLYATGKFSENVVSFARRLSDGVLIVIVPRFTYIIGAGKYPTGKDQWADTTIRLGDLPGSPLRDLFTDREVKLHDGNSVEIGDLMSRFPFAVLTTNTA